MTTPTTPTLVTFHAPLQLAGASPDPDAPADAGPITLEGLAVPWNVTVRMNYWGDTFAFRPGSLDPPVPAHVKLLLDHRPKPFGFGTGFEQRPEGLWATMAIPREELDDPEVAAAVRQLGNGVRDALSVGVEVVAAEETESGKGWDAVTHYDVTEGRLMELSSVVVPRFTDARVARIAASLTDDPALVADLTDLRARAIRHSRKDAIMATASPDPVDPVEPDDPGDDETARLTAHRQATESGVRARAGAGLVAVPAGGARTTSRGRYASFGHYCQAVAQGAIEPGYQTLLEAAWTDEVTGDLPGLMPEAWMRDIVDLMGSVSTIVNLFSKRPLPDNGMDFHQPVMTQGPDVGPQAAEKTEIASRKVIIGSMSIPVQTFAGGQDISMQVLLRSSPDYLTELMRLYVREMGIEINVAAGATLAAGIAVGGAVDTADLNGTFIDAAASILANTWSFPQVCLLGLNWWTALGKAVGNDGRPLFPHLSPLNPVGSFNVTEGDGNVRGLDYAVDPSIDPDLAVIGLRDAFRTWSSPMRTLSVDVPRLLGRDVAVFEFVGMAVTDNRGLIKLTLPPGTVARAAKSTKS